MPRRTHTNKVYRAELKQRAVQDRAFYADAPNEKWLTDLTEFNTTLKQRLGIYI